MINAATAGVLYYGDTAANNVRASDFVEEVSSRAELERWLAKQGEKELSVLNVSLMGATPCVHIFPAVLALAKNMAGYASFARLLADANEEACALAQEFNVVQVNRSARHATCSHSSCADPRGYTCAYTCAPGVRFSN